MDEITKYFDTITNILKNVLATQHDAMEKAAQILKNASINGHNIYAFGCSHAGLITLDLYYRTGGMATINPVRAPGLCLDVDPATLTSQMERLEGYGRIIMDALQLSSGDVVIIHSVSGRNNVTVDAALRARERNAIVIALTNMAMSTQVKSRHPSGLKLYQTTDVVLDNCGTLGDASLSIPGLPDHVGPTSTAIGATILNAVVARAIALITEESHIAPVFISANLDGGDEHNARILDEFKDHIFYM